MFNPAAVPLKVVKASGPGLPEYPGKKEQVMSFKTFAFALLNGYRRISRAFLRLSGKTAEDIHYRRVVSGKAWEEFCDGLKAAGAVLQLPGSPKDQLNQAEGYRYLSRLLRAGLENFIEFSDPAFPVLRRPVHETVKIGADNPDNYYMSAKISGGYTYRVFGNRGTVNYLGFGTQRGDYGTTGGLKPAGYLEAEDMQINADGSFEMIISTKKRTGNWLPMTGDTTQLIVRQTFLARKSELPASLSIERTGVDGKSPEPFSAEKLDKGLSWTNAFVAGTSMLFARWTKGFKKHANLLPEFDADVSNNAGGDANITYYHSYWVLEEDEALVIDTRPPECRFWNFQLDNYWMESLDYRYLPVHINKHSAVYRPDGSVRIIVADENPGVENFITTAGHREGTMCFRWVRAEKKPRPVTRVVKLEQLLDPSEWEV